MNKRGADDVKKAKEYFELAVHEDPDFALGFVGIADSTNLLGDVWGVDSDVYRERAKAALAKALELDPDLAEAHTTNGLILRNEYRPQQAEEEFRKAIELKPSYVTAHHWYSMLLEDQLRWDEAFEQVDRALELDPLSPLINNLLGGFFLAKRDYGKAIEVFKRTMELGMVAYVHYNLAVAYGRLKMFNEMKREFAIQVKLNQASFPERGSLHRTHADAESAYYEGDKKRIRDYMPQLEELYHKSAAWPGANQIAGFYFLLGDVDKGFEWLEQAYSKRESDLLGIQQNWDLDDLRTDPRYLDLLKRLGLGQTSESTNHG